MSAVLNQDVAGLDARINRFIVEFHKSVSSGISQVTAADQARAHSYLNALDTYKSWIVSVPELDLPESHPTEYELEPTPEITNVDNESANDIIRMFLSMKSEVINGQSARRPAGLIGFDEARLTALIAKARSFLTDYVALSTPLDLPESSPQELTSGKGKGGI